MFSAFLITLCLLVQDYDGKTISKVEFEGFEYHDFHLLKNLIKSKEGMELRLEHVNDDIKSLWDTGYFSDISKSIRPDPDDPDKVILKFTVVEKIKIEEIRLIGNSEINSETLMNEVIKLTPPFYFDKFEVERVLEELTRYYKEKGHHFSEISYDIVKSESGEQNDLVYRISEGPPVYVDNVFIEATVDDIDIGELKSKMTIQESNFLSSNEFVMSWLESDMDRIKRYLRENEGYLAVFDRDSVFVIDLKFSPDKGWVDITIFIDPGSRYNVTEINIKGNKEIGLQDIRYELQLKKGEIFSDEKLFKSQMNIRDLYEKEGYLNISVNADSIIKEDMSGVYVNFDIEEGNRVYVGKIDVKGNTKTKESRVRLDLRSDVVPGEPVNVKGIQRAVRRLIDRGWFQNRATGGDGFTVPVEYKIVDTSQGDIKDVEIKVVEGSSAQMQLAVGYSDAFGATALISLIQQNFDIADVPKSFGDIPNSFSGAGQTLSIRAMPQTRRQTYDISFVEPYLFSMDVGYNLRVFNTRTLREAWTERRTGTVTGLTKRWENLSVGFALSYYGLKFTSLDDTAPQVVRDLEGTNIFASVTPSFVYDNRDSFIIPTEGFRFETSYEIFDEMLNSDFEMAKFQIENQMHFPVYEQDKDVYHTLSLITRFGWLEEYGITDTTPISERFFGGSIIGPRGFRFRGVGPRENDEPVGGNAMVIQSLEYSIPVVSRHIYVAAFYDLGNIETDLNKVFTGKFRSGTGFEFRVVIPFLGNLPARIGFGFVLAKRDEDRTQFILFDLGPFFR